MQAGQKAKIERKIVKAPDFEGIYRALKEIPAYKNILKKLSKEYHMYYNPKNQRFETDTSDASHYLDCTYDDVKETIITLMDNNL